MPTIFLAQLYSFRGAGLTPIATGGCLGPSLGSYMIFGHVSWCETESLVSSHERREEWPG
jgi:hypothetical protein